MLTVYSRDRKPADETLSLLRAALKELGEGGQGVDRASLQGVVDALHRRYFEHRAEQLSASRDPIGWHRAFCTLSLAVAHHERLELVHIGDSLVAELRNGELVGLAPIHNVGHEFDAGTLVEAGIPELENLNSAVAEVVVGVSPGTFPHFKKMKPAELAGLLGDYHTRVIGDRNWVPNPEKSSITPSPPLAYVCDLSLSGTLDLVFVQPARAFNTPEKSRLREVRAELDKMWPSASLRSTRVERTTGMNQDDLGVLVKWQEGSLEGVYVLQVT